MDSSHIAIITLLSKAKELEDQRKSMETEKQELDKRIKEAALQIKDLYSVVHQLQSDSKEITNKQPQIEKAKPNVNQPSSSVINKNSSNPYPFGGSLRDKLLYILHEQKRFLHSREIAEYIVANEPEEDVEKVLELISKQVARYKRNNIITSVTDETGRHTFYGLPEWLDENKKPVRGYEFTFKR